VKRRKSWKIWVSGAGVRVREACFLSVFLLFVFKVSPGDRVNSWTRTVSSVWVWLIIDVKIHTSIHTYIHTYIHAYIHAYIHTYLSPRQMSMCGMWN